MAPMKTIIFYGTFVVLHKNIIKIKSNNYYIFKDFKDNLENLSDIENVIQNSKKRENLDKEYFIKESLDTLSTFDKEMWYVFEYESTEMKTYFKTTATNTITTFKVIGDKENSSDSSETSETSDSRYK